MSDPTLTASGPGWYGKLPALGDFASRRLPPGFIATWDDWLQRSLATSRQALGERWLDRYLHCPVWRFVLGPGTCGDTAWAGVLMPSTDRVGRYFPLTIAAAVPWQGDALARITAAQDWFDAVEQAALSALDVNFGADDLDAALPMVAPIAATAPHDEAATQLGEQLGQWWMVGGSASVDGPTPVGRGCGDLLNAAVQHAASRLFAGRTLWWRTDSEQPGRLLATRGLPDEAQFASLLEELALTP